MKVYHGVDNFIPPSFPVVTTGTFDGVHEGHMELLNRIKVLAKENKGETVVVSFDPHPRSVIHPHLEIKLLHTIEEKIDRLEKAGIDHFVIIPFTKEFSRTTSFEFVRDILVKQLDAKLLVIGYDHQFGRNREGSVRDLEEYAVTYGFEIEQIEAQTFEDINISSTKIRKALSEGDFDTANQFLGYDFTLSGEVIKGNQLGHSLGFPTANLEVVNSFKLIPANGVYVVEVIVRGELYGGMLNIGSKPTVNQTEDKSIEVNIFDFNSDIYGENIQIRFKHRLRSEEKFNSIEELKIQLATDKENSLLFLSK
ncbi:MAG: bifunctional riboflavin kinase/FAD synthetase [Salibacteraceae bacterium]